MPGTNGINSGAARELRVVYLDGRVIDRDNRTSEDSFRHPIQNSQRSPGASFLEASSVTSGTSSSDKMRNPPQ